MGLLRNNFISSCTLRKLSLIPSSLLDPRRRECFTPTVPCLPHSTHRDNYGNASLFPTVKLTAKFTRSGYSKSILSRDDGMNRINCVNNQVYVHTEDVEMHLRWQMFTLSYTALIYPQVGGNRGGQYHLIKEDGIINKGSTSLHRGFPSLCKTQMYKKLSHLKLNIIKKMLFNHKISFSIKQRPYLKYGWDDRW